jgi:hypothetical protein
MTSTLYEPLDSLEGEIRLLKIEPTDGDDNAGTLPVRCEMFTYSLTELKQEYHAVSYTGAIPRTRKQSGSTDRSVKRRGTSEPFSGGTGTASQPTSPGLRIRSGWTPSVSIKATSPRETPRSR